MPWNADGKLRATALKFWRCHDGKFIASMLVQKKFQISSERYALLAQAFHPNLIENLQGSPQRGQGQNRRITYLPACSARHRLKIWPHLKTCRLILAPPSCKSRQDPGTGVSLGYKTSGDASGSAIQIFVAAPN